MSSIAARTRRSALEHEMIYCRLLNKYGEQLAVAHFFAVISRLGDGVLWYALIVAIALLQGPSGLAAAAHMAMTALLALALYRALKRWTRRPRPFRSHAEIVARVRPLDEYSFPSGHTLHAVAITGVAVAHYPLLALALVPFTLLVAASRVVLGMHYPSDVAAGAAIGALLAGCSLYLAPASSFF